MITVTCSDGSVAEAEDAEAAVFAAQTLCREAFDAFPVQGHNPTCSFRVDGKLVASAVPELELLKLSSRKEN